MKDFYREPDGSLTIESAVYQTIGAASMCWSETPTGVFDESEAADAGRQLLNLLRERGIEVNQ